VIDPVKAVEKPVMAAKVPLKTEIEPKPPVIEAKAMVEPDVKAAAPAIEIKASVSAAVNVSPSAAAEARATIEVKKPLIVPEAVSRKDEPVDTTPVAAVPPKPTTPVEDISGDGRS
jgi:hypothetical protein